MKKKRQESFYIIVQPGLEALCASELAKCLGDNAPPCQIEHGGIGFSGCLNELYQASLWLRSASRILVRFGQFTCRDFPTLYRKAKNLPWGMYLRHAGVLQVQASCRGSRLNHTGRIAETLSDACARALGQEPTSRTGDNNVPPQTLFVRLHNDICTLSMDCSGDHLHRRGYRTQTTAAPLRENLAAACLLQYRWSGRQAFLDPFCGSGTFAIEAALIAGNRPAGAQRDFAFMNWPGYRQGLWQAIQLQAEQQQRAVKVPIFASDRDPRALEAAKINARNAGVYDTISWQQQSIENLSLPIENGLWLCNPPYGERLESEISTSQRLRQLQQLHRQRLPSWQAAALLPTCPHTACRALLKFSNGGLDVGLFPISKETPRAPSS
ncbi:MAG: hypothetical protein JXR59_07135 [Desulfuromonadaceae bacterium]|nr:hypothetical protein [Desulfuromonadaceae bacterium]